MKLSKHLVLACFYSLVFFCCKNEKRELSKEQTKRPNVILFLVDDMGWTDSGVYGSDLYKTPNIDKLASQGMMFTDGYAACTVCSPTRASIMTGKYPATINVTDWIKGHNKPYAKMQIPDWNMKLDLEEKTLPEELNKRGYKTAHIGKWHLGEDEKFWPKNQGFDVNIGGHSGGSPKANGGGGYFSPYNNPRLENGIEGEYLTNRLADEAVKYINQNKDSAFFLNFWLYNVHTPLQANASKIEKYKRLVNDSLHHSNAVYAAMVEHMDDALGSVMQALKDNALEENTIIIFNSDNGGLRGNFENRRIKVTDNYPLRSGKGDIYEGGVRVPLIFKWPKRIEAGTSSNTPEISADLFPTILGLIDDGEKNDFQFDGVDLSPVLLDKGEVNRPAIFWHYPHYHLEGAKPYSAIRKGDWKLIQVFENDKLELYNLKDDIGENKNLVDLYPEKTNELFGDLNAWRTKTAAQLPSKNLNYDAEHENDWKFNKSATITEEDKKVNQKNNVKL
ncbi:sulfatase [Algibacter mikhailovii]|uniref:Sulfatase n=1 Tax=Algibacter mikhailovii TaxID=425498 RepID=A0A918VAP5_9FLAO|nr:sulfatase [Algibacter mikhailovii]GGZ84304.1 sulfatase [Algibacter mikhailovii]